MKRSLNVDFARDIIFQSGSEFHDQAPGPSGGGFFLSGSGFVSTPAKYTKRIVGTVMNITKKHRGLFLIAGLFLLVACAASPAPALEYEKRWEGKLGGESQYYVPQAMAVGNFSSDQGQELIVTDTDGYAYFLSWKGNRLVNIWITSSKVSSGHVVAIAAADIDGDFEDEAAMLDRDGKLDILGGDRKRFKPVCMDCVPAEFKDFKGEFVAPAQLDRDKKMELLVVGKWKGRNTALLLKRQAKDFKVITAAALDAKGEIMSLMPATTPTRNRFFMYVFLGKSGDPIKAFHLDEEGVVMEPDVNMKDSKMHIESVFAADTDRDGTNELFIFGSRDKGVQSKRELVELDPGKSAQKAVPAAKADASFLFAPDLNSDGVPELLFADYAGNVSVLSCAVPSIQVNGKPIKAADNMRMRQSRAYVAASAIAGFSQKRNGNFLIISGKGRTLALDLTLLKSTLKTPEEEEAIEGATPFFTDGNAVFIDALSAASALGFKADWDLLSQTLKLNF